MVSQVLKNEAKEYLIQYYDENGFSGVNERIESVWNEIDETGTYLQTSDEVAYGAKVAWRNSNRCIGRLFWERMHVLDERDAKTAEEIVHALFRHLEYATNDGKIRPTLTVFEQGSRIRIWNHQLIRYAGYREGETIIGDPASLSLTELCMELGWRGERTEFDILPIVFSIDNQDPEWHEIPRKYVKEVELTHPHFSHFEQLQLKWYGVPVISDMRLEIGGLSYYAAPFNGWYMGTEIGARNLADDFRYNRLEQVADLLEIETKKESTLWRDEALLELNRAVLYSFQQAGVSIVDHHTAAKQFQQFMKNETDEGRTTTGDWTWLIPPMSPAQTKLFHQSFSNEWNTPNFLYEKAPYQQD